MITVNVHANGKMVENDLPLSSISDVLGQKDHLLWLDVADPTDDDIRLLAEEFSFHPLAIEDVSRRHQRPKIDFYEGVVFIVFSAMQNTPDGSIRLVEVDLFIGENYVVTVHEGPLEFLGETRERWSRNVEEIGNRSVALLLYSILDAIVDGYFPCIDELSDRIEDLEASIFEHFDTKTQQEIFRLKKDLLGIRRVVAPERDVLNVLVRRESPVFDPATIIYFQDIYDHILRVTDAVDTYRDLMSSALDSYLSVTSNRLNQVMKTLTASSIILMSMTLVASIYGMNFDNIPELHWRLGYYGALTLMVLIGAGLGWVFKRIDWL
ncbi:MAG TPA: magnesium/cobalt transporter CorA [Thermomicrobiales bacterium]